MKKLVIAEKPSVARDIARVLGCHKTTKSYMEGKSYIVTWALGHLVTLADPEDYNKKYKEWKMEDLPMMPERMKLVVIPKTRHQFQGIKECIFRKDVDEIIIATDAGREGELVARWILEKAGNKKPIKRLWISSVTDKAIKQGFASLKNGRDYDNLYRAAVARAEADWLVGINATRALTCKHNAQLSCGRVQTPTLAMIAAKEEEIRRFVPKSYYGMTARGEGVLFTWKEKKSGSSSTFEKEKREKALEKVKNQKGRIIDVQTKKKKTYSDALYDLTELQRDANLRFGYSAKQTLNIMQRLYEHHKVLTYPRTDSRYLTEDIVDTIPERIAAVCTGPYKSYAAPLLKKKIKGTPQFVNNKKVSDHHAIIPTEQTPALSTFSMEERKIYDLVVRRFLAVLYPPCEYEQTTYEMEVMGERFVAQGNVIMQKGYRELTEQVGSEEKALPKFSLQQEISSLIFTKTEGKTTPPARFNEATLLKAMENPVKYMAEKDQKAAKTLQETGGLGTVATRADIIDKLFANFFLEKKGNDIYLTGKARQLLNLVPEDLKKPELTASWEQKLNAIAKGQLKQGKFMGEIRTYTKELMEEIQGSEGVYRHDNLTSTSCPECGKKMLSVSNKQGKLLVCQDRNCGHRIRLSKVTNARCPQCHKKMELVGSGEKQRFVCVCGHKESMDAFKKRREQAGAGVSKKDVANYMKKQQKEAKEPVNNAFAEALANLFLLCIMIVALTGCGRPGAVAGENYKDTDFAMGTVINQNIYGNNGEALSEKVLDVITRLENVISWRIDGTEVNNINKTAGQGGIVSDNEKLAKWLTQCEEVYEASSGLLDITVGPAARLWDIGGDNPRIPAKKELSEALKKIDGSKVKMQGEEISLDISGGQLDLGAVGKGIACDEIAEYLTLEDLEVNGTFSVGGSVLVYGEKPDGSPWKIGIQDPRGEEGTYMGAVEIVQKERECTYISTSGDYEKYFEEDGVRYHHILDPRTGAPAESDLISVTIVSDSGFLSDALSTACFVAGKEEGIALAEKYGAEILVIDQEKKVSMSQGMEKIFSSLKKEYQ